MIYVKLNVLKINFKLEFQSNAFEDVRHEVCIRWLHCDVACLTVTDENRERRLASFIS